MIRCVPFHTYFFNIYENYACIFPMFESFFFQVMDQCTENYERLVINNSKSNKLS